MMLTGKVKVANERRHKRLHATYPVKFEITGFQETAWVGNTHDLSASGLRCVTSKPFFEGSVVHISLLPHPLNRVIRAVGRVVRVRKRKGMRDQFVMSVCFLEISREDQARLDEYIEYLSKMPEASVRFDDKPSAVRKGKARGKG